MTRVKICGVTRVEDAAAAVGCGAHALGVILVEDTPRYLGDRPELIRQIVRAAGPYVTVVAVVRALSHVMRFDAFGFGAVQYYQDDMGAEWVGGLARIRVVRVGDPNAPVSDLGADDAILLDSYDPNRLGGAGRIFDWQAGARIAGMIGLPTVVAGGLNPANVGEAIRAIRPYAVDVSSGVESAQGIKDPGLVRSFIEAVQRADADLREQERNR